MRKARIILAVIIPLLFVSSGYYYLVTHPPQTHVKKEIVAMPVVYADNLTYKNFPFKILVKFYTGIN